MRYLVDLERGTAWKHVVALEDPAGYRTGVVLMGKEKKVRVLQILGQVSRRRGNRTGLRTHT
jgi:hypothetical protein